MSALFKGAYWPFLYLEVLITRDITTAVELATYLFELSRLQGGPIHCVRKGRAGKVKEMEITKYYFAAPPIDKEGKEQRAEQTELSGIKCVAKCR